MSFLLMDFGTTSIKTAVVDLNTGIFSHLRSYPSVQNCADAPGHYEVSPTALHERFHAIANTYARELEAGFEGIALCSEQNGFLALDEDNMTMTNYVSWKDERSLERVNGEATYSMLTDELGDSFKRITGWRPGPGLPIMNATHMARLSLLDSPCKLVSLPEWLALCSGDSNHCVHDTMLHGLCFSDVRKSRISDELTGLVEDLTGVRFSFNRRAPTGAVAGYWHGRAQRIPLYVGIGDHQCSVLGAYNLPGETLSVNIGTGSQVAAIDPERIPEEAELRPYFDSHMLPAVTRIPGGRALAAYVGFLEDVGRDRMVNDVDFWQMLQDVTEDDISDASWDFDLAIFGSAWGYKGGGSISNIHEGSLTLDNYLGSLMRSFVRQYVDVMDLFDSERTMSTCILSGGVPRRIPALQSVIARLSGYKTLPACEINESLMGLRTIALVCAKRASSCLKAQSLHQRSSLIEP